MARTVRQIDNRLSREETRFCEAFVRSKDSRAAAIAAGYPQSSADRIGEVLSQSLDIQTEVLRLCGSRERSAFVAKFNAINDAAMPEPTLAAKVAHARDRLAATKLPPPGELIVIERRTRAVERAERKAAKEHAHAN